MKVFELANPSDKIHLLAETVEVANLAAWPLSPAYTATCAESDERGILGIFGDPESAWKHRYGRSIDESMTALKPQVADCLASFAYGDAGNAVTVRTAITHMAPEQAKAFLDKEDDRRRSSMSRIVAAAHQMSERLNLRREQNQVPEDKR